MKNKKKSKKKGFTLIEILVVVLILGILAAIAVSKYQKSVLKSKFATLLPIAKAVHDGQEIFFMANGRYSDTYTNLDISLNTGDGNSSNLNGTIINITNTDRHRYVKATKEGLNNNYIMFQQRSKYFPNEIHCEAKTDNELAVWLCEKELGGQRLSRSITEGYSEYVITGDGNGFFPKDYFDTDHLELTDGDTCTTEEFEGCGRANAVNGGECIGNGTRSCYRSTFTDSVCTGNAERACIRSTYNNSDCRANYNSACAISTFNDSTCQGNSRNSCRGSTYNDSYCYGNSNEACSSSTFKGNSICYANVPNSCGTYTEYEDGIPTSTPSTYQDNACCMGEYCPDYAPRCP